MLRPFTFGEIREPSSWCWSWIDFWWRHRNHSHAPWWAKRYYGPLKDPPDFDNFTRTHARTACEGFMTRWFCGSRCAMRDGEEPAQLTFARRQDMTARAVCAAKYVYALVGELEDAQGLLDGLQAGVPALFSRRPTVPSRDIHVVSSRTPPSEAAARAIEEATAWDQTFYDATRTYMHTHRRHDWLIGSMATAILHAYQTEEASKTVVHWGSLETHPEEAPSEPEHEPDNEPELEGNPAPG